MYPSYRTSVLLSVSGREFTNGEGCYYNIEPRNYKGHPFFDY